MREVKLACFCGGSSLSCFYSIWISSCRMTAEDVQTTRALARHEKGEAVVMPVMVRAINRSDAPFVKF